MASKVMRWFRGKKGIKINPQTENNDQIDQVEELPRKNKVEKFLEIDALYFSHQLTIADWNIIKNITPDKLKDWNNEPNELACPYLRELIKRMYELYYWTLDLILSTKNVDQRKDVIKNFLKIAQALKKENNLNACKAIVMALTAPEIKRLEKSWKKLSHSKSKILKKLVKLFSSDKNHFNLLARMLKQKKKKFHCIPCSDLYVEDHKEFRSQLFNCRSNTVKRLELANETLTVDKSNPFNNTFPDEKFVEYETSFHITDEKQNMLQKDSYYLSHCLEPNKKHRFYRVLKLEDLDEIEL